jgi:hypothetical protein
MLRGQYNFAEGGPAGLQIKSIRPTQKEIDDFVNMPIPIGQMMPPAMNYYQTKLIKIMLEENVEKQDHYYFQVNQLQCLFYNLLKQKQM